SRASTPAGPSPTSSSSTTAASGRTRSCRRPTIPRVRSFRGCGNSVPWMRRSCTGRRSEEHTSELQSPCNLVCRLLLEKKNNELYHKTCLEYDLNLLVIQGTIVSAEYVSKTVEPPNLKLFISSFEIPITLDGLASYRSS